MCLNPITIQNPYYNQPVFFYDRGSVHQVDSKFRSKRAQVEVPCGHCAECRNSFFRDLLQRAQIESMTSYVFFVTLTYDDAHIPTLRLSATGGEYDEIHYADVSHIQDLFKRLRNESLFADRDFRYIWCSEYGSKRFRPHHHLLFFVAKKPDDHYEYGLELELLLRPLFLKYYGKNIGTRKHPIYDCYLTPKRYKDKFGRERGTFDLRLVRDLSDPNRLDDPESICKATSYLLAYVNKPSRVDYYLDAFLKNQKEILDGNLYRRLSRLVRSRIVYSKHFGFGFFETGKKVMPAVKGYFMTHRQKDLSELLATLPPTLDEYVDSFDYEFDFDNFRQKIEDSAQLFYLKVDRYNARFVIGNHQRQMRCTFNDFLATLDYQSYIRMIAVWKYYPTFVDYLCKLMRADGEHWCPTLLPKREYDDTYTTSRSYKYLRDGIDASLRDRIGYFGVPILYKGNMTYFSMCRYFRRYILTIDDWQTLYHVNRIKDYDTLQDSIEFNAEHYREQCDILRMNEVRCEQNRIFTDVKYQNSKYFDIFALDFNSLVSVCKV